MKYGFEVEIEDIEKYPPDIPCIDVTTDNSLRNGKEYVSKVLPDKDYTLLVYDYLSNNIKGNYSERCGLHFHMNVQDKNKKKCLEFIKRYIMVERTLFKMFPDDLRINNNFCNLLVDSTEELNIIRNYNVCDIEPHDYSKYLALNIKTMLSIGTFEFRALKAGTSTSTFNDILNVFEQLWDLKSDLPFYESISEEDRKEAESIINIINTEQEEEESNSISDDYMNQHFNYGVESGLVNEITEETIRNYLNSIN